MNKRIFFLAFFISLFFIVWTSYTLLLEIPFNDKRLAEGFLLLLAVVLICTSKTFQNSWIKIFEELKYKSKFIAGSLAALLFLGLISAALSNYPTYAFLEVSHFYLLFNLMMLCIIAYLYNPSWFEYGFLSMVGLLAGLYLINVSISYLYGFFIPDFPLWPGTDFIRIKFSDIGYMYPEPFLNFINYRFFNQLQTWSLPLLTLLIIHIPKRYWAFSKIAFIIACGWWMLVFAADARGTMIASFLALGFIFFMYWKKAQHWLRAHSITAIIGLGLYLFLFEFLSSSGGGRTILTRFSGSGRLEVWEYAFSLIMQNPFFGVGPMHYAEFNEVISKSAPHNAYLQILSEWGIPAGILFLTIITIGSYNWFISSNNIIESLPANSNKANIRVALTASLLAALIHALVTNSLNTPMSQIMMVLVLAWMIGILLSDEKEKAQLLHPLRQEFEDQEGFDGQEKPVQPWFRFGLIGVNLLAAGFLIWSYATHIPKLKENRYEYVRKTGSYRLSPRYWDQGIFGLDGKETGDGRRKTGNRRPKEEISRQ